MGTDESIAKVAEQSSVTVPIQSSSAADATPAQKSKLSKNEMKKLAKQRQKEAAKAAKEKPAAVVAAEDISKNDYGELPMTSKAGQSPSPQPRIKLCKVNLYKDQPGDTSVVTFRGTVENSRSQGKKLAFLNIRQKFDSIQAVVFASDQISREMVKFAGAIPARSTVAVYGTIKSVAEEIKSATIKDAEVHVTRLFVIAKAEASLPMQVEDAERALPGEGTAGESNDQGAAEGEGWALVGLSTRLNNRTMDLRSMLNHSIFAVKKGVVQLFTEYMHAHDFEQVWTPKLLGAASEGGSNVFEVKYFDRKAYLAQSPQLYKQMMIAAEYDRVFEIGQVFRAENSNTTRHLTEFVGLDLEMVIEHHYHEVVLVLIDLMLFIFNGLNDRFARETTLVRNVYHVEPFKLPDRSNVPIITYSQGIKMLREAGEDINDHDDLSTLQEKLLGRLILEKYDSDFYVLDEFPLLLRPFYTMPSLPALEDPSSTTSSNLPTSTTSPTSPPPLSNSYDFFMRGQEILSGAQRIHDAPFLTKRMAAVDPPVDPSTPGLAEYVQGFRYGCPPHGGAGLGLERIVCFWLGLPNIRLASCFPRDPSRIMP